MEGHARSRVTREEWAKRIERWGDSGLSAAEFAAELGINARTLTYWKWMLRKEACGERGSWPSRKAAKGDAGKTAAVASPAGLVEIHATVPSERFELELGGGRLLRIPRSFEATELRRVLEVLEAR